jgi:NAD(P)-dependent dehydrogenase (short-subunit alcohol dehydrogenase family)
MELGPPQDTQGSLFKKTHFQTKPRPPPPSTTLTGKTGIVTGSNIGIGLECTRQLLDLGLSTVIMAVRSVEKGTAAAAPLRRAHPKARIEVWVLDMLSYASITAFVDRCAAELPRLDFAVLNAGMGGLGFRINPSTRHEEIVQTNYLSTALLAILLLPVLRDKSPAGTPGRLTIVGSITGLWVPFENRAAVPLLPSFDKHDGKWGLKQAADRYATSKTLVMMLVAKLGALVDPADVVVNSVEPGWTKGTGLQRGAPWLVRMGVSAVQAFAARTVQQAGWTYVDAVAVASDKSHGSFIVNWDAYP